MTDDEVQAKWGEYWHDTASVLLRVEADPDGMVELQDVTPEKIDTYLTVRFGSPDGLPFQRAKR